MFDKVNYYKSKGSICTVTLDDDGQYHLGEAFFDGGVRSFLFFHRNDLSQFLKKSKYRRVYLTTSKGTNDK